MMRICGAMFIMLVVGACEDVNRGLSPWKKDADTMEEFFFKPEEDDGFWCRYYNRDC